MSALSDKQFFIVGGVLIGGLTLLWLAGRKAVGAAVETGAGIVTGDNAVTKGTPYEGAGILGTLGAVANEASGGVLQSWGEKLGAYTYEMLHPDEIKLNEMKSQRISE